MTECGEPGRPGRRGSEGSTGGAWRLRAWSEADAPRLVEIIRGVGDLERQLPFLPASEEEAERLIREALQPRETFWAWCVEHEGAAVGTVCCAIAPEDLKDESAARGSGVGWISYWSAAEIRGTGLLSRAVRAVTDWALKPAGGNLRRLELGYRVNNPGSGVIARRAGFTVEGRQRQKFVIDGIGVDVLTAARLREDAPPPLSCTEEDRAEVPDPRIEVPSVTRTEGREEVRTGAGADVHHIELWTGDFSAFAPGWRWVLERLGASLDQQWPLGESWSLADGGAYLVIEQSSDVRHAGWGVDRRRPGMNHLALWVQSRDVLDSLREALPSHGWSELFGSQYPHAGGPEHTALYLENDEGFELELVCRAP